jgi:hypothetical protein
MRVKPHGADFPSQHNRLGASNFFWPTDTITVSCVVAVKLLHVGNGASEERVSPTFVDAPEADQFTEIRGRVPQWKINNERAGERVGETSMARKRRRSCAYSGRCLPSDSVAMDRPASAEGAKSGSKCRAAASTLAPAITHTKSARSMILIWLY